MRTHRVELDITGERTAVPELVGHPRPDLVLVNDDDLTYCKLRLDEHSLATIRDGGLAALGRLAGPHAVLVLGLGHGARRRAGHPALPAAGDRQRPAGVGDRRGAVGAPAAAAGAGDAFADPDWAEAGLAEFADAAIAAALAAAPGSDHQFAWVHAAITAASTEAQLDFLADLLSGGQAWTGWPSTPTCAGRLLQALVACGRAGEDEIAEQAAADRSSAGVRAAATARALIPTAEAKEAAWTSAVTDTRLSNAMMRANMGGFTPPVGRASCWPRTWHRYFERAAEIWQRRTPETAKDLMVGLFPSWSTAINAETVALADEFLADRSQPGSLRRLVSEGRSELARAIVPGPPTPPPVSARLTSAPRLDGQRRVDGQPVSDGL